MTQSDVRGRSDVRGSRSDVRGRSDVRDRSDDRDKSSRRDMTIAGTYRDIYDSKTIDREENAPDLIGEPITLSLYDVLRCLISGQNFNGDDGLRDSLLDAIDELDDTETVSRIDAGMDYPVMSADDSDFVESRLDLDTGRVVRDRKAVDGASA